MGKTVINYQNMDFQGFINTFAVPCAILSVQKVPGSRYGEIRIVKANDFYKDRMGIVRYRDQMLYSELVPKDDKFEDFCYRSAVLKQKLHAYVETKGLNCWTDSDFIPLNCEENDLAYCAFFFDLTREPDPDKMSMVSHDTATDIIKNFITLRASTDFNTKVTTVIEDLQQETNSFCCCLLRLDSKNKKYEVLCEKFNDNSIHVEDYNKLLSYDIVASWEKTIGLSNGIIIKDEEDIQKLEKINPLWAKNMRWVKINSLILYPLVQEKKHTGYLFITNFDTDNIVKIKELVELTSYFLSSEVANYEIMEKLEKISTIDLLTGVKNRNAMNLMVDSFVKGETIIPAPFGIVFAKIKGLKQVNADNGHDFGDRLLKKAAILLEEHFPRCDIYRSAGDEFMVVVPSISISIFTQLVEILKQDTSGENEICFSVGSDWNEEGRKLRRSMHNAVTSMESAD
ncbi:MAG: GGDEF domain-containing protein [Treponema sp.]|nr:GGDEF domain-containing protein [Treponema sp.]